MDFILVRIGELLLWHYVGGLPSRRSLCLFWRETKHRAWTRDFRRDRKWGRKSRSERSQRGELEREPSRGQWAKRDAERQSRMDSRSDQTRWVSSPEWTTVSRRRQWARWSKMSWHSYWLLSEFHEKYTPSDSLQDARKAVQKSVTKLPFLHLELT